MTKIKLVVFVVLCAVYGLIHAQISESFEDWGGVGPAIYNEEVIMHGITNIQSAVPQKWISEHIAGVSRTNDAYAGDYAVIIHNWYNYGMENISYVAANPFTTNQSNGVISGYYKYVSPHENDGVLPAGLGRVVLYNTMDDIVATTEFELAATDTYQHFSVALNNIQGLDADSILISFHNTNGFYTCNTIDGYTFNTCNFLYLDEVAVTYTSPVGLNNTTNRTIKLFPNPSSEYVDIEYADMMFTAEVYNEQGDLLFSSTNEKRLFMGHLPAAVYFVKILDENRQLVNTRKIVKQ